MLQPFLQWGGGEALLGGTCVLWLLCILNVVEIVSLNCLT